ncbi:MAG: hypothetical protein LRY67_06145 [Gammaproteobacteria bacterium]|nr:hypothetical protein [Gammaproteobacteria bacterium]
MMSVLECHGIGAKKFLQGQLTCDMNTLRLHTPQFTAACNIKGRVVFTLDIVMKHDDAFDLYLPKSMNMIAYSHLNTYAKFSKCVLIQRELNAHESSSDEKIRRIYQGIPTIYPETSDFFLPQRLNLHHIPHAISFKKGCYLGQEIIARFHFKGTLKHQLLRGIVETNLPLTVGELVHAVNGEETGWIIDYVDDGDKQHILFVNQINTVHPHVQEKQIDNIECPIYLQEVI